MTIRQTIAKLFKLGPKPEERRKCEDCKWYIKHPYNNIDLAYCRNYATREGLAIRARQHSCGPRGKYWEGKVDHVADVSKMICKHAEDEICASEYAWGTPPALRPVLCTVCMRFIKSSAMLAKTEPCKD